MAYILYSSIDVVYGVYIGFLKKQFNLGGAGVRSSSMSARSAVVVRGVGTAGVWWASMGLVLRVAVRPEWMALGVVARLRRCALVDGALLLFPSVPHFALGSAKG